MFFEVIFLAPWGGLLLVMAAALLNRVGLLPQVRTLQLLAVHPGYWLARALWFIHPRLIESLDVSEFRTYWQWRRDYARQLERKLVEVGVRDAQIRHRIIRARLALCDEISQKEGPWSLTPMREYGRVVVPDPWIDGHPRGFSILGYRVDYNLAESVCSGANQVTATGQEERNAVQDLLPAATKHHTPELIGVRCWVTGIEHFLPRAMMELWRSGFLPSRYIPTILAQLEPRLRRGDFLVDSIQRKGMRVFWYFSVALEICLVLVGPGWFLLARAEGDLVDPGLLVVWLIFASLPLGFFVYWQRRLIHWHRLDCMSRRLAKSLAGASTST